MSRWWAWILVGACGGATPGEPVPVEVPAPAADAGPGGLSAPVAEALGRAFAAERRVRCEVVPGVDGAGALDADAVAATVDGGWFAAVVPADAGEGVVRRDGKVVAALTWTGAAPGAWAACALAPVVRYPILGLVQEDDGKAVAGARVRGCEAGADAVTNDLGRFELTGVTGLPCALVAVVDDAAGVGRSEPLAVRPVSHEGAPADVLVELTLLPGRVAAEALPAEAERVRAAAEAMLRDGLAAEVTALAARIEAAGLSPEARRVADGWLEARRARLAAETDVVSAVGRGDRQGLLEYWLRDR